LLLHLDVVVVAAGSRWRRTTQCSRRWCGCPRTSTPSSRPRSKRPKKLRQSHEFQLHFQSVMKIQRVLARHTGATQVGWFLCSIVAGYDGRYRYSIIGFLRCTVQPKDAIRGRKGMPGITTLENLQQAARRKTSWIR
jgi:hypothetical protein